MTNSSPDPISKVLVTGALGNVGGPTVEALRTAGIGVRAADLFVDRLRERWADRSDEIETIRLDFEDSNTFGPALEGCDGLFLLRPPPISRVGSTLNVLVDHATRSGVRHAVFSSVAGAERNRIVPHHRVETHLRSSGIPWTMLRPGFFAQNLGDAYRSDITEDHRIYVPARNGRVAFLDVADLADVAALVFADPAPHVGHGYHLTGPEAVELSEVAELMSDVLDQRIVYEPATAIGYMRHLNRRGLPLPAVLVQTVLHLGLRKGDAQEVDPTVSHLLGHPARTLRHYVEQNAEVWRVNPR